MNNTLQDFALRLLSSNPNIANNPQAKEYLDLIRNGDAVRGQQIANNLCKTYGMSVQDAIACAKQFFHI